MKLALIVRTLGTRGGTERFVFGLAKWLRDRGHQVAVWCEAVEQPLPGIRPRPLRANGRGRLWKMWRLHRAAFDIPRDQYDAVLGFVRGGEPDLYRAGGGCHAAYRRRLGRQGFADRVEERLDRAVVRGARRVVANSQMAADELQSWYNLPKEKIRLIRNGVDLERFQPGEGALPVPQPAVAFLGSGFARKGLAVAIRAVARLTGVHLAVIGHDARAHRYHRLAARLGVDKRVHLLGASATPERLLAGAKAMILPTRYDPFANACLEALACGVPVITSGANGAAEVLPEPWMTVSDPADVEGFAIALERALQTEGLGEMKQRCRAAAERLPAGETYGALMKVVEEIRR